MFSYLHIGGHMDDNSIFGYTLIEFITALAMSFMLIYFLAPRYEAYTVEKRREAKQKTTSETAVLINNDTSF